MHCYIIYVGITHINQLTRLYPGLIRRISQGLKEAASKYGGISAGPYRYDFQPRYNEAARNIAEAAYAMHALLQEHRKHLYGSTVLIAMKKGDDSGSMDYLEKLALRVFDEDRIWLDPELVNDFNDYFELSEFEGIYRINTLKNTGLRFEERLARLLIRPDRISAVKRILLNMKEENSARKVFVLRGIQGSGKRATLHEAMKTLYPENGGNPITLFVSSKDENPLEPIVRVLSHADASIMDALNGDENYWWASGGKKYFRAISEGMYLKNIGDQNPIDMGQAFYNYIKAFAGRRRQDSLPAYVILDGYSPDSETILLLRPLLPDLLKIEGVRLIVIRDTDDFTETYPLPGKGHGTAFRSPAQKDWARIITNAAIGGIPEGHELEHLILQSGGNLYRLFHSLLLLRKTNADTSFYSDNPSREIADSLDVATKQTLFLVHAGAGLVTRALILERFSKPEERHNELLRYNGLTAYGLIREESDGRARGFPCSTAQGGIGCAEYPDEARSFGEYLYRCYKSGMALDLIRLFRYLSAWGPENRAITVLEEMLESLLTQRQLAVAGNLLKSLPALPSNLENQGSLLYQEVVSKARLRYRLLTENTKKLQIDSRTDYSGLSYAQYAYTQDYWDEALKASKKALFSFQKSGNHNGETYAHIELAMALLAKNNIRDASEHLGIAHRIGNQIGCHWGVFRAAAMRTVTLFLSGNLSECARECEKNRKTVWDAGRRDLWLFLTLTALRISWELGRFEEAVRLADEGRQAAEFYSLGEEHSVLSIWKGRCLLAMRDEEGTVILESYSSRREALAFLAEQAWINNELKEAKKLIRLAHQKKRLSIRLQGEVNDWSDGYFPIEGRLADSSGPLDVLGDRIQGLKAYFEAGTEDANAIIQLDALLERDGMRISRPYSYHYALWAAMTNLGKDKNTQIQYMSRAFNDLQARAARIDDIQSKNAWLTMNYWNKLLMKEAKKHRFI